VADMLMMVPYYARLRYVAVLFYLLLLELPTPFGLVDVGRDHPCSIQGISGSTMLYTSYYCRRFCRPWPCI